MHYTSFSEEDKCKFRQMLTAIQDNQSKFLNSIKEEIEIVIRLINKFDKKYILGGISVKLIKSIPTLYHKIQEANEENFQKDNANSLQPDDNIETILEYAMSIALSSPNTSKLIPIQEDIDDVYNKLLRIKTNFVLYNLSELASSNEIESDQRLRSLTMIDTMSVRGDGYYNHILEIYNEMFRPFNEFLKQYYSFDSKDIINALTKLDSLVYSKISNTIGPVMVSQRLKIWMSENEESVAFKMKDTGKNFINQFIESNPDLYDEKAPDKIIMQDINNIKSFDKLFWVIPQNEKDKMIFNKISQCFGENSIFLNPAKFKAFPLNDSLMNLNPIVEEEGKYFHFSTNLPFRNIFQITENLLEKADSVYYENTFKGNSNENSRDNYIESKTKQLFEKLIPSATFYHSLDYHITEEGLYKKTELDILGISNETLYIIEVKAGKLNKKHRLGAIKGLKDRLSETINEGSYQCHRALQYINESDNPKFEYNDEGTRKTLTIDKSHLKKKYKISVTLEHFSFISANLKYLIESNILSPDYKWAWIISLYDLMIFADVIENELDFQEYLENRIALYNRNDVEFVDEIDILGCFLKGNFPLKQEKDNEKQLIIGFKDIIDKYYEDIDAGIAKVLKPKRIRK